MMIQHASRGATAPAARPTARCAPPRARAARPQPAPQRQQALPGMARRHGRRALACRADVNYDAFRAGFDISSIRQPAHTSVRQYDFVVIGSGIAGLSYALKVAPYGSVAVVTKDYAEEGCTQYAQGGVCAVLDAADSVDSHVADTMVAGGHLNDRK
jgi:L-aspartate oxidase